MRIPFALQFYRHRDLPLSAQRVVNLFAEAAPVDAKSRVVLLPTPGLEEFANLPTGPVRGMAEMGQYLYVVSGARVYRVSADATFVDLGAMDEGGRVTMAGNGTQMAICNPDTGTGWVATPSTLTQITDPDFEDATSVTFLDGYTVWTKAASAQFFFSAINDAASYDALDFATAESSPDNLVRAARVAGQVWLFGERTTEIWGNDPAEGFPFRRVAGGAIDRGCAARDSVAVYSGLPLWLGDDRVVYAAEQYALRRISTHALEQEIGGFNVVSDAHGWCYGQDGHVFYCLAFPSAQRCFVYDVVTQMWHERESFSRSTWRAASGAMFGGIVIAGDADDGRLYRVNPTLPDEDGDPVIRVATGTCFHSEARQVFFTRFVAEFVQGVGRTSGQGEDPQVFLSLSDDGGRTWGDEMWAPLGRLGEYRTRVEWRRLGRARERVFRLVVSDPVRTALLAADVEAEAGED